MNTENKNLPKDVFLHLLGIITLYVSAISLITLFFQYINLGFPDPLENYGYMSVSGPIRWAMASLIIIFPVYLFVSWLLHKDAQVNPEKRELKIRKWLVYFTLFITAVTIITDLVTLIYNFLGGDLTARFALKILVVLLVAGKIFWYYLWDLKGKWSERNLQIIGWSLAGFIIITIAAGFFTVGSPLKARLYRFDSQRISDLETIQNQIVYSYWLPKSKLPVLLSDLKNDITQFVPPVDPDTKMPYEYRVTGPLAFELCATFTLPSGATIQERMTKPLPLAYQQETNFNSWNHETGRQCFARTIDPELYPKPGNPIR